MSKRYFLYLVGFTIFISCTSVKYKTVKERVFYAESNPSRVSVHCTAEDPSDKNSFTYLYLVGDKRIDEFIFRRPWSYKTCLLRKNKIKKILNSSYNVRLLGFDGELSDPRDYGVDDQGYVLSNPRSLPVYSWIFDRIESDISCEGYFESSCSVSPSERYGKGWVIDE